jgi:hypothetical protein
MDQNMNQDIDGEGGLYTKTKIGDAVVLITLAELNPEFALSKVREAQELYEITV